jgi:hypothetical protein
MFFPAFAQKALVSPVSPGSRSRTSSTAVAPRAVLLALKNSQTEMTESGPRFRTEEQRAARGGGDPPSRLPSMNRELTKITDRDLSPRSWVPPQDVRAYTAYPQLVILLRRRKR